jgi:G protein beta subunit-like protein
MLQAKIWDVTADFELGVELSGHKTWVWDAAFSADSSLLVTASSDTTARIWDSTDGKCVQELKGHQRAVTAVALSDA